MKNFEILEAVLTISKDFRLSEIDENLYVNVKETTENLISVNPHCKISDLLEGLRESTIIGATKLLVDSEFNDTVRSLVELANKMADDNDEFLDTSESSVLSIFLKTRLVKGMMKNSYNTSKEAIIDAWNSKNKME